MNIGGFQKLTLLDYPELVACIVFTAGCNFRCPYCHNGGLVIESESITLESEETIFNYLIKRRGILDGVVISGGEPLLQEDIEEFIKKIKVLGYKVKLDTNGTMPDKLEGLLRKGLVDYVAMDIKNSSKSYYKAIGHKYNSVVKSIKKSIDILKNSDIEYEFRTTVVKGIHSKEDIIEIAKWIKGDMKYYIQSYVKADSVIAPKGLEAFSNEELNCIIDEVKKYCPLGEIR